MPRDYYDILGVDKKSTDSDIKKAYRKLAREHHPDMVAESDKKEAEKRFKEINEAYQVLSDPEKKKMYDQFGHAGPGFSGAGNSGGTQNQWGPFSYSYTQGGANPFGGNADFDPMDIFEEFFGFRGYRGQRKPKRGKNLTYELVIEFKDAVFGLEKEINVESGKVKIKIPAGVRDGTEIKYAGKGMPGPDDAPAGDLYIIVRYRPPNEFNIRGRDIYIVEEIDFITAALGGTIEIPVVDLKSKSGVGKANLKVPSGTQYGTKFMVKGKGMPVINRSDQGNVIVQVGVTIPKRLSKKQRKILEDYSRA